MAINLRNYVDEQVKKYNLEPIFIFRIFFFIGNFFSDSYCVIIGENWKGLGDKPPKLL